LNIDGDRHRRARNCKDRQGRLWAIWKCDRDPGFTVEASLVQQRCDAGEIIPELAVGKRFEPSRDYSRRVWLKLSVTQYCCANGSRHYYPTITPQLTPN
jgi:hypothetical protein